MTSKSGGVTIGVLFSSSVRDKSRGAEFLRMLMRTAPQYSPEWYSDGGPVNNPFVPSKIEDALSAWGGPVFLWRHGRPRVSGEAYCGYRDVHDSVVLTLTSSAFRVDVVLSLFREVESTFGIDLAYIQIWSDRDMDDVDYYKRHTMPFSTLSTHELREGIPDMPWAMFFGAPYVNLFGIETLMSAPVCRSIRVGRGVFVQVTEDHSDPIARREVYLGVRNRVRLYLDRGAFRGSDPSAVRSVPTFFDRMLERE